MHVRNLPQEDVDKIKAVKVKLQERHLYGRMVYYPMDTQGDRLLRILNQNQKARKCFALQQLDVIKELGYEVEIEPFQYFKDGKRQ